VTKRTAILALVVPLWLAGCGEKQERKKQVGPLKDWIIGTWVRNDDPIGWVFGANGEFATTGRVPIEGRYEVVEPDTIKISISGAGAMTASSILGVPLQGENRNLYLDLAVKDDEMRPSSIASKTVFRKK
jgi:hypothetical protein